MISLLATRGLALFLLVVITAVACSSDDANPSSDPTAVEGGELIATVGNSELAVGPNRVTVSLLGDDSNRVLEAAGQEVVLLISKDGMVDTEHEAEFVWAIPDVTGFFVSNIEFPSPGEWELIASVRRDGSHQTSLPRALSVRESSISPNIGDPVPRSENRTLADADDISLVSTDPSPQPELYQMTVAEALDAGRPLVVTFATPAFCRTQFCGLVVENVKAAWEVHGDDVNFVHVEPFELDAEGELQLITDAEGRPDIIPVPAIIEWKLQTEPWVFVLDSSGLVTARFEGTVSVEELDEAIEQALS